MERQTSILVVDDEPDVLEAYSSLLRSEGYMVREAQDGESALVAVQTYKPNLVVLDVGLPDLDGMEVCRRIKSREDLQDIFVILISGIARSVRSTVDGLKTGADGYLVKPIEAPELLARIQTIERLQRTTAALRASQEHHSRLLEILPDAIGLVDLEGRLTSVNRQAVVTLGYEDAAELIGKSILDLTPATEHERLKAAMGRLLAESVVHDQEYFVQKKSGELIPVEASATLVRNPSLAEPQVVVVVRDISQRKQAEGRIRQLLDLVDQAQDSIIILDSIDRIEHFNRGAESLLGWDSDEVRGKTIAEVFSPEYSTLESAQKMLNETGRWSGELHLLTRGKQSRIVESRWRRVQATEGGRRYTVLINTDITERKRTEVLLRQNEELSQRIIATTMDGFWAVDLDGRIVDVNEAYCRFSGYSREEVLAMHICSLDLREPSPEKVAEHIKRILHQGCDRFETLHRHKNGKTVAVEVSATALLVGAPRVFAFLRDITERKRVEDELRRLPQRILEAQEAERLRVAQELHDGVNQIIASAKMRLRKVGDMVQTLSPAGKEILARCEQLLVEAVEENRRIAHNLRPSDLDELGLFQACRNFCILFRSRTNLRVHYSLSRSKRRLPPPVELSSFRIVQEAFSNIEKHSNAASVNLRITLKGGELVLRIMDNGRGFEPKAGKQGQRKRKGLGLTNMEERARSMGGTCLVETTVGRGTSITVRLPCVPLR